MARARGELYLVLHDAGRPEQSDDVGLGGLADAREDLRGALAKVAGRRHGLELLPCRAGLDLDLRADAAAVVVQPCERDTDGMVRVAAIVADHDRRPGRLRGDQIGVVVLIEIARQERAWILERDLRRA